MSAVVGSSNKVDLLREETMTVNKIFVVGAGNVGAGSAFVMASRHVGDIFLYDIIEDFAVGQAMDINQSLPFWNSDSKVKGGSDIEEMEGADIVVVTAGIKRQEGMTRIDLLKKNMEIVHNVGSSVMSLCPDAFVLMTTNPVDVLTWSLKERWPEMKVVGLGCALDTLRFQFFLAEELHVSVDAVSGIVIGTHNDEMIPLIRLADVGGMPAGKMLTEEAAERIVRHTREGGTDIVKKLKVRSGFFAASTSVCQVVESVVFNKQEIFSLSVFCNGEYGFRNISLSLPAVVGEKGVQGVIEFDLDAEDRSSLEICATSMEQVIEEIKRGNRIK